MSPLLFSSKLMIHNHNSATLTALQTQSDAQYSARVTHIQHFKTSMEQGTHPEQTAATHTHKHTQLTGTRAHMHAHTPERQSAT